jgi:hypothetical protein
MQWRIFGSLAVLSGLLAGQTISESEVVGQADARIEKYRKGEVVLRLTRSSGKSATTFCLERTSSGSSNSIRRRPKGPTKTASSSC